MANRNALANKNKNKNNTSDPKKPVVVSTSAPKKASAPSAAKTSVSSAAKPVVVTKAPTYSNKKAAAGPGKVFPVQNPANDVYSRVVPNTPVVGGVVGSLFSKFRANQQAKRALKNPINQTGNSVIDDHLASTMGQSTTADGSAGSSSATAKMSSVTSQPARDEVDAITGEVQAVDTSLQTQREEIQAKRLKNVNDLEDLMEDQEDEFKDFQKQIEGIQSGSIPYTPEENAMLESIKGQFDILRRRQIVANQNFEGGTNISLEREGIQRFAPELAAQEIQQAVQVGIDKLKEIDLQLADKLSEVRKSIIDNKVDLIKENFSIYKERVGERRSALSDLRSLLNDSESYLTQAINENLTTDIKEYNLAVSQGYNGSFMEYQDYQKRTRGKGSSSVAETYELSASEDVPDGLLDDLGETSIDDFRAQLNQKDPPDWFNRQYLLSEDDPEMLDILAEKKFIPRKRSKAGQTLADLGLTNADLRDPEIYGNVESALPKVKKGKLKRSWKTFRNNPRFQGFQLGGQAGSIPASGTGSSGGSSSSTNWMS